MMNGKVMAISDCDHADMLEEREVCRKYGLRYVQFACKTEEDLIRELPGYTAVINQYAPFTERVFLRRCRICE